MSIINNKTSIYPLISKGKEFYHNTVSQSVCHVFTLWALLSFVFLFKVLWSAALASAACTDVCCWNAVCPGLKRRRTGAERKKERSEWRGEWERRGKRESPGEVNGWNARRGSVNELHAELGGDRRYCVEAAGVRVAVTDTKNNISWQKTLWPSVYLPTTPLVPTGGSFCDEYAVMLMFLSRGLWNKEFSSILAIIHDCRITRHSNP